MFPRLAPSTGLVAALALSACSDLPTDPTATGPGVAAVAVADGNRGAPRPGGQSIAAVAISAGFTELVAALTYVDRELAGLVDLLPNGKHQYTVCAPTNVAFQGLYPLPSQVPGTPVDAITDLPAPAVLDVLRYPVAEGRRAAVSVVPRNGLRRVVTLPGESFTVRPNGTIADGLTGLRADAAIVAPDQSASSGIIHVSDQVIVPPSVAAALTK